VTGMPQFNAVPQLLDICRNDTKCDASRRDQARPAALAVSTEIQPGTAARRGRPVDRWRGGRNGVKAGARYAQNRPRGSVSVRIGGRLVDVEGGQAARLVEAQTRAQDAIARVRELDKEWRPRPSAYESVEGLIRTYNADAEAAQARASELARVGIGPGPFGGESIPARGPERNFNVRERTDLNRIGAETGCHTCGTTNAGTSSGNFVADHQPPSALNNLVRPQRLFPQCLTCSLRQGGWITSRGSR
jgi:hypothetical protein